MEDTKKMEEAAKPEELAERAPLTDEELDQASGGLVPTSVFAAIPADQAAPGEKATLSFIPIE